jgi:uncharacterized iron-regulated membrane protein
VTTFRLLWQIHKWTGIVLGIVLLTSATTGFLLLIKKDFHWIQPTTQRGTAGPADEIAPMREVYAAAFALDLPQLRTEDDIERVDFRPDKRVFKIHSRHDNVEVQVDAIGLRTWGPAIRRSDWLEQIHDGQFFGKWAHGWLMPIASVGFVLLACTGYLIWIWPKLLKRRRRLLSSRT